MKFLSSNRVFVSGCVFLLLFAANVSAEEASTEEQKESSANVLKRITVVDSEEAADEAAGSASFISGEELERAKKGVGDINRVLRQVPGVNIQEEDGYGLRPNIGFRGVPSERSARITLMEDGVLIAPAPYAAPSAYFFPNVSRMEGVEVVKGPGQIKYGPYTTGGALNLLSRSIPEDENIGGRFSFGNDNTRNLQFYGGKSWKYGGVLLETSQIQTDGFKDLDSGGDTGFDIEDYNLKVRLNTDPEDPYYHELTYKGGIYDQLSNETYVGLADSDFGDTPFRRYAGTQRDNIDVDHIQHHLTYHGQFDDLFDVTATLYYNETQRNWYKLERVGGTSASNILSQPGSFASEFDWLRGADSDVGAFDLRNNRREYESTGVQTVVAFDFEVAGAKNEVEIGARFHSDEEDRFQEEDSYTMSNGTLVLAEAGAPGSQANRIGSADAWAFYVRDTISMGDLTLTPGVRYERINYTREDFGRADPGRTGSSLRRNDTNVDAIIPGMGVRYEITEAIAGFVGVHKGFSPPGPTSTDGAEEEESVAYEAGASFSHNSLFAKAVLFYTDYDNLLGADTVSSGGEGTGELFNAGEVDVYGVEFSSRYDFGELFETDLQFPARLTYTYTNAEFKDSFDSDFFGVVEDGDPLTYTPEHQAYASIGATDGTLGLYFDASFVDTMVTELGTAPGVENETDSYVVFDVVGEYQYNEHVQLFASVENVFDREYVVARRPAGARPGRPLTALAGIALSF